MDIIDMYVAKRLDNSPTDTIVAVSCKDRKISSMLPGWNKRQIGQALSNYMNHLDNQYHIEYRNQEGGGRYYVSKKPSRIAIEMQMGECQVEA
jgi:hypothetical protein